MEPGLAQRAGGGLGNLPVHRGFAAREGHRALRGDPMSVRRVLGLALVAALALSCGRKAAVPTAPPDVPHPSRIEAVFPPARSAGVFYETAVWVEFTAALDPATISDRTVFFKVDTRRLPATLGWDPAKR